MKSFMAKLATGFIMIIVTLAISRGGYAAGNQAGTALANFRSAYQTLQNSYGGALTSAFNSASAAYGVISDGHEAAEKAYLSLYANAAIETDIEASFLTVTDDSQLTPHQQEYKRALLEAEKALEEWTAALNAADSVWGASNAGSQSSGTSDNSGDSAYKPSNDSTTSDGSGTGQDGNVILPEPVPEEEGTPNPEGEARITQVGGTPFLGKPSITDPKLRLIYPNPDGSSGSTAPNPFVGPAPAINPQGGFTDPNPEGGGTIRRLTGPAPAINLRAPLINPDPEGSASPSSGTPALLKGKAPTITNPRAPQSSQSATVDSRNLRNSRRIQGTQAGR